MHAHAEIPNGCERVCMNIPVSQTGNCTLLGSMLLRDADAGHSQRQKHGVAQENISTCCDIHPSRLSAVSCFGVYFTASADQDVCLLSYIHFMVLDSTCGI